MIIPKLPKGTPVKVVWLDAECEAGWLQHTDDDDGELPPEAYLTSYGLLISTGPKFLSLGFCYNKDADDWLGRHRIPIGMIVDVVEMCPKRSI